MTSANLIFTQIYNLILPSSEEIKIIFDNSGSSKNDSPTRTRFAAILQTCKQVNEEGTPILYGNNTFCVYLRKHLICPVLPSVATNTLSSNGANTYAIP